ncbi:hypothetical protein D3C80_1642300 [compost metagenome]
MVPLFVKVQETLEYLDQSSPTPSPGFVSVAAPAATVSLKEELYFTKIVSPSKPLATLAVKEDSVKSHG